ncbi:MAG: transporter substrate-binding domain-containing protein [Acidobacteriota bacterium]
MRNQLTVWLVAASLVLAAAVVGCSKKSEKPAAKPAQEQAAATPTTEAAEPLHELNLPESMRAIVDQRFTGDLDGMIARRVIRAGVPFNRTFFFLDKGTPRGLAYEYLVLAEDALNKYLKTGALKVHMFAIPMSREALLPSLQAGKIDMIIAQVTVTPERQKIVDFTRPTRTNVDEIVVTAPGTPPVSTARDLSGRPVFVRKDSTYHESLLALNTALASDGRAPVDIRTVAGALEDDDLLEMVNAGLIPATIVDDYLANFWKQVFTDLNVHPTAVVRSDGQLAVAVRKNSPKLVEALNSFIAKNGLDKAIGATLNKRYLQSTKYAKNATSEAERKKFIALVNLFRKYGDRYQFDYLLMAAQGYQESRLNQDAKSAVGAVGVMQLMPETGKEQKVGDIKKLEPNVHAGVKYMRFIRSQFFDDQPMDDLNKALFTFAAYNAGPGRVRQLRQEAAERQLDPNVRFGNVERIASERIGRETVTYVSNIYKYYVAYKLIVTEAERKKAAAVPLGSEMP